MMEIREEAGFGRIRLARPEALNALTLEMVQSALEAVRRWEALPSIHALWIESNDKKAFCAGGDVRTLIENPALAENFFRTEYALDQALHRYPKPVVVLGQGLVLGGGFGLFAAATHRIVTETTQAAMPEVRIGFFPDVGASWFLGRLPKPIGLFFALTGSRLDACSLMDLGLATHFLGEAEAAKIRGNPPSIPWLEGASGNPPPSPEWTSRRKWIETVFLAAGATVPELFRFFQAHATHPDPWIARAMKEGQDASPHSLDLILRLFKESEGKELEECFAIEENFARLAVSHPDFQEGVRTRLIEKAQHRPRWKSEPAT